MIKNFPELRQIYGYDCGASATQSMLIYYGLDVREDKIMRLLKTSRRYGTRPENIVKVLSKFGLEASLSTQMSIEELKAYIKKGRPVIMDIQAWSYDEKKDYSDDWDDGHYVIAIGYDEKKFYFEDPSSVRRTYLSYKEVENRWHDKNASGKYYNLGIVVKKAKPADTKAEHMG